MDWNNFSMNELIASTKIARYFYWCKFFGKKYSEITVVTPFICLQIVDSY